MDLAGIVIWAVLIGLALWLLLAIAFGRMSGKGSTAASITAFHDMQPRDKQNAVEVIVEQKAGKKLEEQKSGEGMDEEESTKEDER
ncbi:MAG TPA: hypothetical protein DGH68_02480 [Bacteroidetes bacterium]|jgi:hypothetical protein|nr:hypothetical protein [Bacteroidota bacterium]